MKVLYLGTSKCLDTELATTMCQWPTGNLQWHCSLQWRYNDCNGVLKHQPHDCLLNRLFKHKSKKTTKFRVTGLCAGNLPVTGEFTAQRASNTENVSIWWRHLAANEPNITVITEYTLTYTSKPRPFFWLSKVFSNDIRHYTCTILAHFVGPWSTVDRWCYHCIKIASNLRIGHE